MYHGKLIAEYIYDAWGNCEIVEYSKIAVDKEIANINPFRYKGYYWDSESNLYYSNSKYYSSELYRWISPNSIEYLDLQSINGLNLYCYMNKKIIKDSKLLNKKFGVTPNSSKFINLIPSFNAIIYSTHTRSGNYWNPHWKNKIFDTDWPTFFSLSNDGFEIVSWGLSGYKGSYYLDNDENHSLYVSFGNAGVFGGLVFPKDKSKDNKTRFGFDASVSAIEIGYDGRIIDASVSGLTLGATCLYKNGKFEFGLGAGWYGLSASIDFVELYKLLFGGE